MIHDKKTARDEGQRIANDNGAPVWIDYDLRWGAYRIHPEPPPDHKQWDRLWIIEPNESEV